MAGAGPGKPIGFQHKRIVVSPTITSGSAYAAGNALGGLLTFPNAAFRGTASGIVRAIAISDKAKQASAMDLILFIATFTATTDKTAFAPSAADLLNALGVIPVVAGDYSQFSANALACVRSANLPFDLGGSNTDLFGQLVCRGTPTYTSISDLQVGILLEMD